MSIKKYKNVEFYLVKYIFNSKVLLDVIIFLCLVFFATGFGPVHMCTLSMYVASTRNRE